MHEPYGASKITNKQLPISTSLLHARSTDLLTDAHGPQHTSLANRVTGSLRAPQEVHHAHMMIVVACMALTMRSINILERVWWPLAVAHFTGSRSLSSRCFKPPVRPARRPARQLARSDPSGTVAPQGRMGPLKCPINIFLSARGCCMLAAPTCLPMHMPRQHAWHSRLALGRPTSLKPMQKLSKFGGIFTHAQNIM